nr:hypothetical protein Q903MT_gene3207 [Picea sitchensis]
MLAGHTQQHAYPPISAPPPISSRHPRPIYSVKEETEKKRRERTEKCSFCIHAFLPSRNRAENTRFLSILRAHMPTYGGRSHLRMHAELLGT